MQLPWWVRWYAAPLPCGAVCHDDQVQVPVGQAGCAIVADVHLKQRSHVGQAQLKLICRASRERLRGGSCQLLLTTAGHLPCMHT